MTRLGPVRRASRPFGCPARASGRGRPSSTVTEQPLVRVADAVPGVGGPCTHADLCAEVPLPILVLQQVDDGLGDGGGFGLDERRVAAVEHLTVVDGVPGDDRCSAVHRLHERRVRPTDTVSVEVGPRVLPEGQEARVVGDVPEPVHVVVPRGEGSGPLVELAAVPGGAHHHDREPLGDALGGGEELGNGVLGDEACDDERELPVAQVCVLGTERKGIDLGAAVRDHRPRHAELPFPVPADGLCVEDQLVGEPRGAPGSGAEHRPGEPTPLGSLPLEAVHVDDRPDPCGSEQRQPETVRAVHDQRCIRPTAQGVHRRRQAERQCGERLRLRPAGRPADDPAVECRIVGALLARAA